jgi:small subunit ribosomal protein S2
MPYVVERWLGGILTNWSTMYARIQELDRLEQLRDSGEINKLTKKEGLLIQREIDRLLVRLSGVRNMKRLPDLVFVVDVSREDAAVHEANLLNIPVVALVDTNCNPQGVDYVIPSNDDAIRAIKLLVAKVADAVLEGKAQRKEEEPVEPVVAAEAEATTERPRVRKAPKVVETDEEVDEDVLLGEATLAKLSATRKPEELVAEKDKEEEKVEDKAKARGRKAKEELKEEPIGGVEGDAGG